MPVIKQLIHLIKDSLGPDFGDTGPEEDFTLVIIILSFVCSLVIGSVFLGLYMLCSGCNDDSKKSKKSNALFQITEDQLEDMLSNISILTDEEMNDELTYLPLLSRQELKEYALAREKGPTELCERVSTLQQNQINDRGLDAFHFVTTSDPLNFNILVEDKTELTFNSNDTSIAILNIPLPTKNRDIVYYEVKFLELPGYDSDKVVSGINPLDNRSKLANRLDTLFNVGLVTKPYPFFRMPGYNKFSVSYENTGKFRFVKPFDNAPSILPILKQGDVVGVGFKVATGSIFFTYNGRKVFGNDDMISGLNLTWFPAVGGINCAGYKFSVNLGQRGFVFIEANVNKYGLAKNFGCLGAPPLYGDDKDTKLLDKGDDSIPPKYENSKQKEETIPLLINDSKPNYSGIDPSTSLSNALPNKIQKSNASDDDKFKVAASRPPSYGEFPPQIVNSSMTQKNICEAETGSDQVPSDQNTLDTITDTNTNVIFDRNVGANVEVIADVNTNTISDRNSDTNSDTNTDANTDAADATDATDEANAQQFLSTPSPDSTQGSCNDSNISKTKKKLINANNNKKKKKGNKKKGKSKKSGTTF